MFQQESTMKPTYEQLIRAKQEVAEFSAAPCVEVRSHLFPYQSDLVRWALARGRAAIFADTGLGKAAMLLEWARNVSTEGRVLIVAPLAVGHQIAKVEAVKFDIECDYVREDTGAPIVVSNYEMLHKFDLSQFAGVVLDESSILKSFTGKFRNMLIESCREVPYRLACTATPAPNDFTELGNHSEWLGVKSRTEMLAEFFVHDGGSTQDWRLKGHAVDPFWRWVCRWGAVIKRPSDLGYDDSSHILPPLHQHLVDLPMDHREAWQAGALFHETASGLLEQRKLRRATRDERVQLTADLANSVDRPVLIWAEYNDEADLVTRAIPDAVQVSGSDKSEDKVDRLLGFAEGRYRVLVSKVKIAGFGMNWQHCADMVFLGPSNSYEQTYQAIRRCWRFGQTRPVHVHTICSYAEQAIVRNLERKHRDATIMADRTLAAFREVMREAVHSASRQWDPYDPRTPMKHPSWLVQVGCQ
jgi:superfamily II DNA or RNA helicase